MVVRRERKVRRQRGSRLYGWGQVGQHRKSGGRGGFGAAGFHKHKWSKPEASCGDHFGKDGFVRPAAVTKTINAVNVGALSLLIRDKALSKDDKGRTVLDLSSLGYEKLLGGGHINFPVSVKATFVTENAKKKITEAGGETIKLE